MARGPVRATHFAQHHSRDHPRIMVGPPSPHSRPKHGSFCAAVELVDHNSLALCLACALLVSAGEDVPDGTPPAATFRVETSATTDRSEREPAVPDLTLEAGLSRWAPPPFRHLEEFREGEISAPGWFRTTSEATLPPFVRNASLYPWLVAPSRNNPISRRHCIRVLTRWSHLRPPTPPQQPALSRTTTFPPTFSFGQHGFQSSSNLVAGMT